MTLLKITSLVLIIITFFGCEQKATVKVTSSNVKDVLTQYGSENPETRVTIETPYGTMRIQLYEDTPLHRANFVKLIKEGQYEDATFYRIFYQFMIQAGTPDNQLDYMIPAEFNPRYIHRKGALSMARQDEDNPDLKSSSTEFFIVHGGRYQDYQIAEEEAANGLTLTDEQRSMYALEGGYMSLDQRYTVFGQVTEGMDVIDKIAAVKVYQQDKPLRKIPIKITLE